MKDNNPDIYYKYGTKKISLPQPTDMFIIDPEKDDAPNVPARKPDKLLKSKIEEASMPSFKLLDEDSDEGEPVMRNNNDDDCMIITERTVFDHIREKARSLPSLAANPTTEYPPSEETLSLIRKRTRDRQVTLNDSDQIQNLTEVSYSCEEANVPNGNTPSNMLNAETIFEHIRKKAKNFPRADEIKTLRTKSSNSNFNFDFDFDFDLDSFADAKPNVIQKEALTILNSEYVKPQGEKETSPRPRENKYKSPTIANRQCCSLATAAETKESADPFLGFKSVFSFL